MIVSLYMCHTHTHTHIHTHTHTHTHTSRELDRSSKVDDSLHKQDYLVLNGVLLLSRENRLPLFTQNRPQTQLCRGHTRTKEKVEGHGNMRVCREEKEKAWR